MDHPLYTVFDVPLMYKHVIEKMVDKLQSILERKRLPLKYAEEFRAEVLRQLVEKKHLNHISVSKMRDSGLLDGLNIHFEPDQLTRSKDPKITKQIAQPAKLFQAKTYVLNPHKRVRMMPFCGVGTNQEEEYKRQLQMVMDTQVSPITDQEKEYHRQLEISKLGPGAGTVQLANQSGSNRSIQGRNILHRMAPSPIIIPDVRQQSSQSQQHQQTSQQSQHQHQNQNIYHRHQVNQMFLQQQWQMAQAHYQQNLQHQQQHQQQKINSNPQSQQQQQQQQHQNHSELSHNNDNNNNEQQHSNEIKHAQLVRPAMHLMQPFIEQRCHPQTRQTFVQKEINQTDGAEADDKVEFMSDDSDDSFTSDDEPLERIGKPEKPNNFEELSSDDDEIDDGIDHELIENCKNLILCQYEKIQRIKSKFKLNLMNGMMFIKGRDMLFRKATGEASLFASSLNHQD